MISKLVDCHAHLDLLEDHSAALQAAQLNGVSHVISVGIDLPSSKRAVEFASANDQVWAAVGIHPNEAANLDDSIMAELAALAEASEKVVAIGETGLDFYRDRCPGELQETVLLKHIELARDTGLPLMVHSREASDDIMRLLGRHASDLQVILHCFSIYEQVDTCAERGYYMSVAGNVTFPKAIELRTAVAGIPADLLLTETDSPFLSPVPLRGRENSPANIRLILDEVAALRNIPPYVLAEQVHGNFLTAFNLDAHIQSDEARVQ